MDVAVQVELVRIADRLATEAAGGYAVNYVRHFRHYYTGMAEIVTAGVAVSASDERGGEGRRTGAAPPTQSRPMVAVGPGNGGRLDARARTAWQQGISQRSGPGPSAAHSSLDEPNGLRGNTTTLPLSVTRPQ